MESILKTINQHLDEANAGLQLAAKTIADARFEPVSINLLAIGRALEQIFEIQYQIWALHPDLLPEALRGPVEHPQIALDLALRRAESLASSGAVDTAVGVLELFIRYQTSQPHIALAHAALQRLRAQQA